MIQNNETFRLTDDNNLKGSGTACTWNIVGGIIQNAPPNKCTPAPAGSITITGTRLIAQGASN
jgi:hypothetical protein